jgi:hypothetical protein
LYTHEFIDDFMAFVMEHIPIDLTFMDVQKTHFVFDLLKVISCWLTYSDEHEPFLMQVTENLILFAVHVSGDDSKMIFFSLFTAFSVTIRATPQRIALKMANMVKRRANEIPEYALGTVVECLGYHSLTVFGARALKASDLRDFFILQAVVKWNPDWVLEHLPAIAAVIAGGLSSAIKSVPRRACLTVKAILRVLVGVRPDLPREQGQQSLLNPGLVWHVPSPTELTAALDFASNLISILSARFATGTRADTLIAVYLGRAILRGIASIVSPFDLETEPDPRMQPPLTEFSDARFAALYERLVRLLFEEINRPTIHRKAHKLLLRTVTIALIARDHIAQALTAVSREQRKISVAARLSVMLPALDSKPHICHYWKARVLISKRAAVARTAVTKIARKLGRQAPRLRGDAFAVGFVADARQILGPLQRCNRQDCR